MGTLYLVATPIGNLGDMTQYSNYCVSNSLFISPVLDSQRPARDIITEILEATNSQCFFSEGLLKFVPYGDTTTIGNGAVYTPNTTPIYDLTDDDFLDDGNSDPVRILRSAYQDAFNDVKVEWLNRANSYNPEVLEEKDQSMIELYGLRPDNARCATRANRVPCAPRCRPDRASTPLPTMAPDRGQGRGTGRCAGRRA